MKLRTFLMFNGKAEEAMNFYVSFLPNARIVGVERYGMNEGGKLGQVKRGAFEAGDGVRVLCMDSPTKHPFSFTPSTSLLFICDDLAQFDKLFARLRDGGDVFMDPAAQAVDSKFAWLMDKFGVSWQLTIAA